MDWHLLQPNDLRAKKEKKRGKTLQINGIQWMIQWYNVTCIRSVEERPLLHSFIILWWHREERREKREEEVSRWANCLLFYFFPFLLTWTTVHSNSHLDILVGDKGRNKLSIPQIWAVESTLCHVVHQKFYCHTQWMREEKRVCVSGK